MKNFAFILVIENIKNPNLILSGGVKNKYKGAYEKIFNILNEDFVYVEFESEDEELIGNDFYLYFNLTPDLEKLHRITKIPNVKIISQTYSQGGLVAPNGKPSNLTPSQYKLVRTPAFKKWFGNWENDPANSSKVVDDNGEPLIVYHGSKSEYDFNIFQVSQYDAQYYYFAKNEEYARLYGGVKPYFLNIRNLLDAKIFDIKKHDVSEYVDFFGINTNWLKEPYDSNYSVYMHQTKWKFWEVIRNDKEIDIYLKNKKYNGICFFEDSIVTNNRYSDNFKIFKTLAFSVFEPNQIKIADGTNTEFDSGNDNIRFEKGGEIDWASTKSISIKINNDLYKVQYQRGERGDTDKNVWFARVISKNGEDAEGRLCFAPEIHTIIYGFSLKEVESWIWESYINNELYLIIEDDYGDEKEIIHIEVSENSKFEKGGEINEEAQQLIDIISMHPNLEKYQKYKVLLKDKFGIDFDLMYKDQEYIDNATLSDIKSQDDFFDFGNWLRYAKIISTKRGFVPMDSYATIRGGFDEITDETWNETAKKLDFTVQKVEYEERGTGSGDIARAFGDTIVYTKEADLYYFLHEIGHIYDFQNVLTGIIKNPAYSPTSYGTTHSGETFAENFAIYFINPTALKNWNKDVYYAMDSAINDKYKKELKKIVSEKSKYEKGGRTISQTPAPKKDQVYGSEINKKESSKSILSAKLIKFDKNTLQAIKTKVLEHNTKYPDKKINLSSAKAVVRRGFGAYSSSHRPTISGGKPNSRVAWGLARLNAFTYKIVNGKSKSGKYSQDDDLIEELGFKVADYKDGGKMGKDIRCINCGWEWNKKDSQEFDMYVCHKCGFDNTSFYISDPINRLLKGGKINSTKGVSPDYLKMFLGQ